MCAPQLSFHLSRRGWLTSGETRGLNDREA
jgi:hypothetical protein